MKFAKELEQDLVPEWRLKYFDYRGGKKRIKQLSRALAKVNQTPRGIRAQQKPSARTPLHFFNDIDEAGIRTPPEARESLAEQLLRAQTADKHARAHEERNATLKNNELSRQVTKNSTVSDRDGRGDVDPNRERSSRGKDVAGERSPLRGEFPSHGISDNITYGSILPEPAIKSATIGPPSLELPDPALSPSDTLTHTRSSVERSGHPAMVRRAASTAGDNYEVGRTHTPSKLSVGKLPKRRNIFHPRRTFTTPYGGTNSRPPFFRRFLSRHQSETPHDPDFPLNAYADFDLAQAHFFNFLDRELEKVEAFYKIKEEEASERLEKLHEQLRIMRDRRVHELLATQQQQARQEAGIGQEEVHKHRPSVIPLQSNTIDAGREWLENAVGLGNNHVGKNSKALQDMVAAKQRGEDPRDPPDQGWKDYSRRPITEDVPYRIAKRKLKLALQEYYRGLELLKSYALLNRTAFRKINKKYDKAVMARPPYRYMSEHVNKAWFVVSERLERMIVETEDLYSRYFERGNHKVAVNKLRSKYGKGEYSAAVFRNGLMLAGGLVLGIQGAVDGFYINTDPSDPVKGLWTSYLLQLYGGYTLALQLFLLFVLACRQWTKSKINYVFIFEFDTRDNLDWRQLAELPCLFTLLLGLIMFLNFNSSSPPEFYLWWPVLLIGLTLVVLFFPARILYWRSRSWFLYSMWRLFFAGIYAVEFRDFFLGDMFCSLTYAMQNIEVFFCLYASEWSNPIMCNSNHSRLLGFFSTLPGIWRALQCIRRYYDTRNFFPHLVNCGKYTFTIMFYVCLSLYRIDRSLTYQVLFILFGALNSIYVSIWDLVMDWSLCNPYAPHPLLRNDLGFKSTTFYYTAMIIDPILRSNWLLYVLVPVELQHSALVSFLIASSEVSRRGIWTLIRVENEHCTNVGRFRASRDVPLPYELDHDESIETEVIDQSGEQPAPPPSAYPPTIASRVSSHAQPQTPHTAATLQPTTSATHRPSPLLLRRRQTLPPGAIEGIDVASPGRLMRVGAMLTTAHAQDFERRKKPGGTYVGYKGTPQHNDPKAKAEENVQSSDEEDEEEMHAESARLIGAQRADLRSNSHTALDQFLDDTPNDPRLSQGTEGPSGSAYLASPSAASALGSSRQDEQQDRSGHGKAVSKS